MTETRGHLLERLGRLEPVPAVRYLLGIALCWLTFAPIGVQAVPLVTTESPIGFFTNVATRLLQSQLGVSLNHIQVYPTNQYTPSVHRLLQVTANLYDAITNRPATDYPYLPSVFRPVFAGLTGRTGNEIYISGYQEVTAADTPNLLFNPTPPHDLSDPNDRVVKPLDMVYGIPLVIGAKKGFPNFNKLAMQTLVQVTRRLQFHRPGDSTTWPVNEIDQMYVMGVSNVLGVEAWNSYAANFSRGIQLVVWPDISVLISNRDTGKWLNAPPILSRWRAYPFGVITNIAANMWAGYNDWAPAPSYSFQIPFFTNLVFLTNNTYSRQMDGFVPLTGTFERTVGSTNFYLPPYWELTLKPRLRLALVDTGTQRIVDYVNLADRNVFNITNALMTGGQCGDPYTPDGSPGSMWCIERMYGAGPNAISTPTFGIINQIEASMGHITADWNNASPIPDKTTAINFFKGQFIPGYPNASNTFNAPYQPFRNMYLVTSWQANDPLVHYMLSDLMDLAHTNLVLDSFSSISPRPTDNLGRVNYRYEPWGGNPIGVPRTSTKVDLTVKDPFMFSSDYWDSPPNSLPNLTWLGRVHRGTPWQTIYLKAPGTDLARWVQWTGNNQLVTNWNGQICQDASFTQPTNDWRLASLVISLLNPNDPRTLASANQPGIPAWRGLLDGITVLTNDLPPDQFGYPQFTSVTMSSNSPQASTIASALATASSSQPSQHFRDVGDILVAPELSTASPWLDLSSPDQLEFGLTDEAYEAIPSQLLPLLRPDSIGFASQIGGTLQVQFTGADGYAYVVQTSSNLAAWIAVSTNYPANGSFNFLETPPPGSPRRFYRSVLQP
jgi:hypothetical protein